MSRDAQSSKDRRLFLAEDSRPERPRLRSEDAEHALRVLRLERGDGFVALDGRGGAWAAVVRAAGRAALEIELGEELACEPRPGSSPAHPLIRACVAWPRPTPAEEMLDRLTQLGVAEVVPLIAERSGPQVRERSLARRERLERILRESLKQCGRSWLPQLSEPRSVEQALELGLARGAWVLDPRAEQRLSDLAHAPRSEIGIWVGPEGGWTETELEQLVAAGGVRCRLASAVLRLETAAEAALAVLAALRC